MTNKPVANKPHSESAYKVSLEMAVILMIFMALFSLALAVTQKLTTPLILEEQKEEKLRLLNQVLPADSYDNNLLSDSIKLPPTAQLGTRAETLAYRARQQGKVVGMILEGATVRGYGGQINFLVGLWADGRVAGVRVLTHHETPGLGDYIEPAKSHDPDHPWIAQLSESASTLPIRWKVKKDGGDIDEVAGATITARAVTEAVDQVKRYFLEHRARLLDLA